MGEGGAACVGWWGEVRVELREAAGRWCSSFVAEVQALRLAVKWLRENRPSSATVFSDSQALLRLLAGGGEGESEAVRNLIAEVLVLRREVGMRLVLQWVPGHVGLEGNEWADGEANRAWEGDQTDVGVEFACMKAAIGRMVRFTPVLSERERLVYGDGIRRERCGRWESVLLAQLRVGHCPKTSYWRQRVGLEEERPCRDCGEEEEKDHWLGCVRWERVREELGVRSVGGVVDPSVLGDERLILRFLRRCHAGWLGD